jgi:hypothetical protein
MKTISENTEKWIVVLTLSLLVLFMYWQTGRFAFVLLDDNVRPEKRAGRPLGRGGDIHDE